MNLDMIEKGFRLVIEGLEIESDGQHISETPRRVAMAYKEMFSGLESEPPKLKIFLEDVDQMIVSDDIPFYSFCSHHFLPFRGTAKIAYIPQDGRIVGISKLARVLDYFAAKPTVQEVITNNIANYLYNHRKFSPLGVGVILKASHDCEIIRGVKKEGSIMTTSALTGVFVEDKVRQEFLRL